MADDIGLRTGAGRWSPGTGVATGEGVDAGVGLVVAGAGVAAGEEGEEGSARCQVRILIS